MRSVFVLNKWFFFTAFTFTLCCRCFLDSSRDGVVSLIYPIAIIAELETIALKVNI